MNRQIQKFSRKILESFSSSQGWIDFSPKFTEKDVYEIMNAIQILTLEPVEKTPIQVNYFCAILRIIHASNPEYNNIPAIIHDSLMRIGQIPSIQSDALIYSDNEYVSSFSPLQIMAQTKIEDENSLTINGEKVYLSDEQKSIWDVLNSRTKNIAISAPTSAGKSFVIALYVLSIISRSKKTIIYVVPTNSLITQVAHDFKRLAKRFSIDLSVFTSFNNESFENSSSESVIYVLTQEKAIYNIEAIEKQRIDALIIDEVQNVEGVEHPDNERSQLLLDVIQSVSALKSIRKIILSGPGIDNLEEVNRILFSGESKSFATRISPVTNLTFGISRNGRNTVLTLEHPALSRPARLEINKRIIPDELYQKTAYNQDAYAVLEAMISKFSQGAGVIVFSPTKAQAGLSARNVSDKRRASSTVNINELIHYYHTTVHPSYEMNEALKNRCAYHHRNMPSHVRNTIEIAYKNKDIHVLFTTTTLIQGMNLPAKYMIARNPYLTTRGKKQKLSAYDYANLCGRAGRLFHEPIGYSLIIDPESFEAEQISIFEEQSKTLNPTYQDAYEESRLEIFADFRNEEHNGSNNHLKSLILNSYLKHKEDARERLEKYGIAISLPEERVIRKLIKSYDLANIIKHPVSRVNPLDLAAAILSINQNSLRLPNSTRERNAYSRVTEIFSLLNSINYAPLVSDRRFGVKLKNERFLSKCLVNGFKWANEVPFSEIIKSFISHSHDSTSVEDAIELIFDMVEYFIPKILSPICKNLEYKGNLISSFEAGASSPATQSLISLGLARDLAIKTSQERSSETKWDTSDLLTVSRKPNFSYWERQQLYHLS